VLNRIGTKRCTPSRPMIASTDRLTRPRPMLAGTKVDTASAACSLRRIALVIERVSAGELVIFEESAAALAIHAESAARLVLGSAVKHPHELVTGRYSVHTSPAALRAGESEIRRIGSQLAAASIIR
jgi:hypothetical protein